MPMLSQQALSYSISDIAKKTFSSELTRQVYAEELALAEQRYRTRGSRDEDVTRIAALEQQLMERERRLV